MGLVLPSPDEGPGSHFTWLLWEQPWELSQQPATIAIAALISILVLAFSGLAYPAPQITLLQEGLALEPLFQSPCSGDSELKDVESPSGH